jgi:mRNA-degrading endonuclease RelE of RelBE toxin-antitoxin system
MSYAVDVTSNFKREAKKLLKKYTSLPEDLQKVIESLESTPIQGTPLGKNCFKIRLSIRAKGQGKRGGARGHHMRCRS